MNALRLADAELGHRPDPAGDALLVAQVVDRQGRAEPADALDLEVDDPAGAAADRLGGPLEASRPSRRGRPASSPPPARRGQAVEVVGRHGLLEHQQIVLIQLAENVDIGGRIRAVGIDHQLDVAEVLADRADELDIAGPARS